MWTRETASCACLGTFCGLRGRWEILLLSKNVLSSSAVMPSRFSRRGEGAREGQRALRWRAPREDDVDREPRGPRCALAVSYAVVNEG